MNKPVKMEPGVKLRDAEKMALIPVKVLPTEKNGFFCCDNLFIYQFTIYVKLFISALNTVCARKTE